MLLLVLLFQLVLGDLAPLYQQQRTVDNGALRSYVVILTDEAPALPKAAIQKWIQSELLSVDPEQLGEVWNTYDIFRGFAIWLKPEGLAEIRGHKYVKYVEEDGVVTLDAFTDRQDYGQIRINQGVRNLTTNSASYSYASSYPNQNLDVTTWNFVSGVQAAYTNDGSRATVCVIDTGVRGSHQEFNGRLALNISYVAGQTTDGNGHGTHCAGSCCGRYRGTARNARIFSAKVLADNGSGTNANVISGINWCANQATNTAQTYILSLSLGGALSTAVNDAINSASTRTIPVVAAGNDNGDSCTKSPASATHAITVGASDKDDNKASFSNYGRCLDIWAPGVSIHSSWYTSDTAYNTISGTSMATPLVAGLVATYAQTRTLTKNEALAELQRLSVTAVRNVPAGTVTALATSGRKP